MGIIEKEWLDYRNRALPKNISDIQYRETRQAFYAGAAALYIKIVMMTEKVKPSVANFRLLLDALLLEIQEWINSIMNRLN